jgi:hypothetical protein
MSLHSFKVTHTLGVVKALYSSPSTKSTIYAPIIQCCVFLGPIPHHNPLPIPAQFKDASKIPGTTIPVCFTFTLYFLIRNLTVIIHFSILTGHILYCLLKHIKGVIEEQIFFGNEEEDISSYRTNQLNDKILEIEIGSTGSHPVDSSLWKRLQTCQKTPYRVNEGMSEAINSAHVQVFTVDMLFYDPIIKIKLLDTAVHWGATSCGHYTMMTNGRLEVWHHAFLNLLLEGCEQSLPGCFIPWGKSSHSLSNRRLQRAPEPA